MNIFILAADQLSIILNNLCFIGKFGCSGAFCIIYMFTFEIYPTIVRTTGMGLCSMVARIGAIAAPEVKASIFINFTSLRIAPLFFFISKF